MTRKLSATRNQERAAHQRMAGNVERVGTQVNNYVLVWTRLVGWESGRVALDNLSPALQSLHIRIGRRTRHARVRVLLRQV